MRAKAHIDWETVNENNIPETGKSYLVAELTDDTAILHFAKWYNKGDEIQLNCKDPEEASTEERLLNTIFGNSKGYIIPESGFYVKEQMSVDEDKFYEDDEFFSECKEILTKLSDTVMFAEEPLVPAGYFTEAETTERNKARIQQKRRKEQEEQMEEIEFRIEKEPALAGAVKALLMGSQEISCERFIKRPFGFTNLGVFEVSAFEIAKTAVQADILTKSLLAIFEAEGSEEDVLDLLKEARMSGTLSEAIKQMLNHIDDETRKLLGFRGLRLLLDYFDFSVYEWNFYYFRNKYIAGKKYNGDIKTIMIAAMAVCHAVNHLRRTARLCKLGAPDVIKMNELRIFAEYLIAYNHAAEMEVNEEEFAMIFGITPDGKEYHQESSVGNYEKAITDTEEEDAEDESTEGILGCFDEEEEAELPDVFGICCSPNYKCMEGYYALWNPKQEKYYREEDGDIAVYKTWKDARDACEMVNMLR